MQLFPICRPHGKSKIIRDQRRMAKWVLDHDRERNTSTTKMHILEEDKHRLSDQVGQMQSKLDRAALHRDLIVRKELQKMNPRVDGYQNGQVLYKQPPAGRHATKDTFESLARTRIMMSLD
jgi:hypothetical protein